ncbi:MAG: TolC family protein [Planctomycetes bacterium]|nr:TolC family protein [Planctomycetota bacterium]
MPISTCLVALLISGPLGFIGCAGPRYNRRDQSAVRDESPIVTADVAPPTALVTHQVADTPLPETVVAPVTLHATESLVDLESLAQAMNPRLLRLAQEATAAEAKTHYADKMPDPTIGANLFARPIETAAGSQRANISVMQMVPWLSRLDAQSQQAFFEALSMRQRYEAERLRVVGDVRALWSRLYVLGKQIEINRANLEVLGPLVAVASSRVAAGGGSARDSWLGDLELSKLEEQLLTLKQQVASTKSELNRVIGRESSHPIEIPQSLTPTLPDWTHEMLQQIAREQQPEITAAELQTQATSWGIEVARLKRRPDLSLSTSWFAIDDNRPTPNFVDVGRDAWSVGAQVSIPLWHHKYDAIEEEATWKHWASHASVDDVSQRYDSLLRDLWEQAKTAAETAQLHKETLLPQAKLALDASIDSYSNNAADLDSVVRDVRSVLMLEFGYHRTIGELAVALARIQQAVGIDLAVNPSEAYRLPFPLD